jgi:dissimilatory sulfite reductase (desulfoviridin) alpha/beta subunit
MNMEIAGFALNPSTALSAKNANRHVRRKPFPTPESGWLWIAISAVDMCPTNVIYLDGDEKAVICNLCEGSPKCVEWCPKEVIDNE